MNERPFAFAGTKTEGSERIVEVRGDGRTDEWRLHAHAGHFTVTTRDGDVTVADRVRSIAVTLECLAPELRDRAELAIGQARGRLLSDVVTAAGQAQTALEAGDVARVDLANREAARALQAQARLTSEFARARARYAPPGSAVDEGDDGFVAEFRARFGRDPFPAEYPAQLQAAA